MLVFHVIIISGLASLSNKSTSCALSDARIVPTKRSKSEGNPSAVIAVGFDVDTGGFTGR